MGTQIAAAVIFPVGSFVVAATIVRQLGWLPAGVGVGLGVAVGAFAVVAWATAPTADDAEPPRWLSDLPTAAY